VKPARPPAFELTFAPVEMAIDNAQDTWLSSWPDAVAFALGLAVARWSGWNAGDLVWSLWLSSLVVGYTTIVWMIGQPTVTLARVAWKDRALGASQPGSVATFLSVLGIGALFLLAFFTIHFGGFHYVHSQFLMMFFPISVGGVGHATRAGMSTYVEVARRYWVFLPSAFLAHRAAFFRKTLSFDRDFSLASFGGGNKFGSLISEPYRNVVRMHMLIFFFVFTRFFAGLDNFAVYAVVYAVYFFPWRLVRRPATGATVVSLP
jgi:hypothetical protein